MASKSTLSFAQIWQFVQLVTRRNLLVLAKPYPFNYTFIKNLSVYLPCLHKRSIKSLWLRGFASYIGPSISTHIPSTLNLSHSLKMCLMFFTINPKNPQILTQHLVLQTLCICIHFCMWLMIQYKNKLGSLQMNKEVSVQKASTNFNKQVTLE